MGGQPLTGEEKAVAAARNQAARPKRNLIAWAVFSLLAVLVGGMVYLEVTGSGRPAKPMKDRSGVSANPDDIPSEDALKARLSAQGPLPSQAVRLDLPAPTTPRIADLDDPKKAAAYLGKPERVEDATNAAAPRTTPIDLSAGAVANRRPASSDARGSADRPTDADRNYDASATAADSFVGETTVYSRNKARASKVPATNGASADIPGANELAALAGGLRPANSAANVAIPELSALSRIGGAPNSDARIAGRISGNESFSERRTAAPPEPLRPAAAPAHPVLLEGEMIPLVTTRAIATDLPGQFEARVTRDVYDSVRRSCKLVPAGSRILGIYNSNVSVGQARLQAVASRLIFPNGASLVLDNASLADLRGATGVPGEVNNHFFRIFGTALAVASLSFAVERQVARDANRNSNSTGVTVNSGAAQTPGTVVAQTFANVSERILDRTANIGPTITVPAGERINLSVKRDWAIDPQLIGLCGKDSCC
ncbi:MAG: hypothetical protein ING66_09225 [Rhodocyclaceae bacterium]|jgi:type IV secretory pathway VirB10-like protein|nr:hypothetical protein [Rhodocyclaceae bacterium]MCA3025611.1 hypothetical protein [Rhodocyclaceae bacterium]MCA3028767.1 hypothetical protein [Rhodocyclaceae bacterium]MCA3032886.1 hypothetical protein [Rhodocyclaceae bacterium]MCA3037326.1 hypothetical protein [Rhodocyclaceae bacterium]